MCVCVSMCVSVCVSVCVYMRVCGCGTVSTVHLSFDSLTTKMSMFHMNSDVLHVHIILLAVTGGCVYFLSITFSRDFLFVYM